MSLSASSKWAKGEFFLGTRQKQKIFSLHGGKIEFEFCYKKFKFNFHAMYTKVFLAGFLEKFAFSLWAIYFKVKFLGVNSMLIIYSW